jgi:hypothetical protein
MYPAWRGLRLGERGSLDRRRSGIFTILKGTARAAVAATRGLQSMRQARRLRVAGEQHDALFHKPSRTYPSKATGPPFAELRRVV